MRGVDGEDVGAGLDELGGALEEISRGPDGGAYAQAGLLVLAVRFGVLEFLLDVS